MITRPTRCPTCTPWCATTEAQFFNRLANIRGNPQAQPLACPECGSIDWATSRDMIRTEPVEQRRPWWRRMFWKMRLPDPPSWKTLRIWAAVLAVTSACFAIFQGPDWTSMFLVLVAGYASAAVVNYTEMIRLQAHVDETRELVKQAQDFNGELIEALRHTDAYDRFIEQQNEIGKRRLH
jgi:hypothetical protein